MSNLDQAWKRTATLRRKIQVFLKELEELEELQELQGRLQEAKVRVISDRLPQP